VLFSIVWISCIALRSRIDRSGYKKNHSLFLSWRVQAVALIDLFGSILRQVDKAPITRKSRWRPSLQPSRHHGERGTRKCDGPEFAADADPEMPGQRVDDAGDGRGQEDPGNTRQDMRRGHPNEGSAVEGCREHSLIKQAYS
jgi:hypothetical protein